MALTHIPAAFLAKFHALIDAKFFLFVVLLNITTLGQYNYIAGQAIVIGTGL